MGESKLSFEEAMEKLEQIVKQLEKGEASLEDSLKYYEEGNRLIAYCNRLLTNAEQTVTKLISYKDGKTDEEIFEVE